MVWMRSYCRCIIALVVTYQGTIMNPSCHWISVCLLRRVDARPEWLRAAQACACRLPSQHRSVRLDILSVEECLQPLPHEPDA